MDRRSIADLLQPSFRDISSATAAGHVMMAAALGWDVDAVANSVLSVTFAGIDHTWCDSLFRGAGAATIEKLAEAMVLLAGPLCSGSRVDSIDVGMAELIISDMKLNRTRLAQAVLNWIGLHRARIDVIDRAIQQRRLAEALRHLRVESPKFFGSLSHPRALLSGVVGDGPKATARRLTDLPASVRGESFSDGDMSNVVPLARYR